jgi:chitin deacetylase
LRVVGGAILLACAGAVGLAWAGWRLSKSRTHQLFGDLVTRVETADSLVALTLDDGPNLEYTDSVLAILADSNVRATFFVVGAALARHLDLGRRIVDAGHELGNHSFSHQRMVLKTPGFVRREVEVTDSVIRAAGQRGAIHFRPPYGKRLVMLPWFLSRTDRMTVLWDLEPDSYPGIARDPGRLVDHVLARVRPGSIILLHLEGSTRASGRAALPRLIGALRAAGYEFVTVSQLMRGASTS